MLTADGRVSQLARMQAPYPTVGELARLASVEYMLPTLRNRLVRAWVSAMAWLP